MPVAIQQGQQQKRDPLDTVLKGLQIAGTVYGIKEANAKLGEMEAVKKAREDQSAGVISPQDEASLGQKGFLRVPQGTENAVAMKRSSDGSQVFFAPPKAKAELITPYQSEQLKVEREKLAAQIAHNKASLASGTAKETAKNAPKTFDKRLEGLNATEKGRYDNVIMASKAVDDMGSALKAGDWTFSAIGDNNFTIAQRNFEEALGRMQSGGAIQEEEAKRFRNMAPTARDSEEIQQKKLAQLNEEMSSRLATLGFQRDEVAGLTSRETPKQEMAAPPSRDDILAEVNKRVKAGKIKLDMRSTDQQQAGMKELGKRGSSVGQK